MKNLPHPKIAAIISCCALLVLATLIMLNWRFIRLTYLSPLKLSVTCDNIAAAYDARQNVIYDKFEKTLPPEGEEDGGFSTTDESRALLHQIAASQERTEQIRKICEAELPTSY